MKSKLLMLALAISMLAIAVAGATSAYFTDTKNVTNVFTYGNLSITLTEKNAAGATVDVTNVANKIDYGVIYPGKVIDKSPTVTLDATDAASQNAYIAAKITVSSTNGISTLIKNGGDLNTAARDFLQGGLLSASDTLVSIVEKDGKDVVYYILAPSAQAPGSTLTLFQTMNIPTAWDNAQATACAGLKVTVEAYAVQSAGFTTGTQALSDAFDVFDSVVWGVNS